MTLQEFNQLPSEPAFQALFACCGNTRWAKEMEKSRPFADLDSFLQAADRHWANATEDDWLEAFRHHPKIGDTESLKKKFASTAAWASSEQGSVKEAPQEVIERLAKGNEAYEQKFGFIFIVCATGKSASEMLSLLEERLPNPRETELAIAAGEQHKITHLRIRKLFA